MSISPVPTDSNPGSSSDFFGTGLGLGILALILFLARYLFLNFGLFAINSCFSYEQDSGTDENSICCYFGKRDLEVEQKQKTENNQKYSSSYLEIKSRCQTQMSSSSLLCTGA